MKSLLKMTRKTLRNIVAPLGALAIMFVAGCKLEEPVKESYLNPIETFVDIRGEGIFHLRDLDGDREIDAILNSDYDLRYLAKGYEDHFEEKDLEYAKTMTPEIRDIASKIAQGINEFRYELVKEEYEAYLEEQKEKEEKREARKKK